MQLKLARSQRDGGIVSKSIVFCLDARAELTREELISVSRYKLGGQVIYNSEASKRDLDRANAQNDGSMVGGLKSLASVALAAMKLNITINGLQNGQHIECKTLEELVGAEEAIMTACQNLKGYLDTAATFDGMERLYDFSSGTPVLVTPASPMPLASLPQLPSQPSAAPQLIIPPPAEPGETVSNLPPGTTTEDTGGQTTSAAYLRDVHVNRAFDFDSMRKRLSIWWAQATTGQRVMAFAGGIFSLYVLYHIL